MHPMSWEEAFGAEASARNKELASGAVIEPVISTRDFNVLRWANKRIALRELWLNGFTIGKAIHK